MCGKRTVAVGCSDGLDATIRGSVFVRDISSLWLRASFFQLLIKEVKHRRFPRRYPKVNEVMPFLRCFADRRIYLQAVCLPKSAHLLCKALARADGKVVLGVNEEGCGYHSSDCGCKSRAQLRRAVPTVTTSTERDYRAYGVVP